MMLSNFEQQNQAPSLSEVDKLLDRVVELRDQKDMLNKQLKDLNEELDGLEAKILAHLEESELTSFDGSRAKVSVTNRFSWRVPQALDKKLAFFDFLKKRKCFNELVSVNSQTLNSFCKTELEAAQARGEFDFTIPGIEEPSHKQTLSVRRK